MKIRLTLLCFAAASAFASDVALEHLPQQRLILVARGDTRLVEAYDDRFASRAWSAEGVAAPRITAISRDNELAAFADPIANEVVIISSISRTSRRYQVPETPVAMRFIDQILYVLSRDGGSLTRISAEESRSVSIGPSPTHLSVSNGLILVYSSLDGSLTEFDPDRLGAVRTLALKRFASDFESDQTRAYLIYPRTGNLVVVSLRDLKQQNEFTVGAVPVDVALEGDANLISAGVVSVADPSSKRIWQVERGQSTSQAFGRGFLRGLLGLGLYSPNSAEFPTGIDRIWVEGGKRFAYDSSSGKLYQIVRGKGRLIAQTESSLAATVSGERLAVWNSDRQLLEFRRLY